MYYSDTLYIHRSELYGFLCRCIAIRLAQEKGIQNIKMRGWWNHCFTGQMKGYTRLFSIFPKEDHRRGFIECLDEDTLKRVYRQVSLELEPFFNGDMLAFWRFYHENPSMFERYKFKESMLEKRLPRSLYKYCSNEATYFGDTLKGVLSFTDPVQFNDPEDCDFFRNGRNERSSFRVLCLAQTNGNPKMWKEYAGGGNGACIEHNSDSLVKSAIPKDYKGIVIYGKVSYRSDKNRPVARVPIPEMEGKARYLLDVINHCFVKTMRWREEKEYRFLAFANGFIHERPVCLINDPPSRCFFCNQATLEATHLPRDTQAILMSCEHETRTVD